MFKDVLVVGSGSAGLLAALTLKRTMPELRVRIVRSPEISIITVGESTTPNVPAHIFDFIGISRRRFHELVDPTWKMGIHFLWGKRPAFEYSFEPQLDLRSPELPRPYGYYCDDDFSAINTTSAMMAAGKAFARLPQGGPNVTPSQALHLENHRFVKGLEVFALEYGIEIISAKVQGAEKGGQGIVAVVLEDGRRLEADFFVDASGFRSELITKVMEEPYISYASSLFNDRAVVGGWARNNEPTLPYTTAETMDCGWCWRIDHVDVINRGYVHCSAMISEEDARAEFLRKNPKATLEQRTVKFRSGRNQRTWIGNVMGIGNASGFVEPLESTALMMVCWQMRTFCDLVKYVGPTTGIRDLFNKSWADTWDEIRDFLSLHFWANTRLDTPYWQRCRADTDISRVRDLLDFYQENGPTGFARYLLKNTGSQFGIEGFLVILVGCQVPYRARHTASPAELEFMRRRRQMNVAAVQNGVDVQEALQFIKHPAWRWADDKPGLNVSVAR